MNSPTANAGQGSGSGAASCGDGPGGGIFNFNGSVMLSNSAVTGNTPDNCFPPGTIAGCTG